MSLPPYAYVPGSWPHPTRDQQGHSYGRPELVATPLSDDPDTWPDNEVLVRALELFDHGYYWEAHEGLEALWIAAGREGSVADLLSAIIKLAAAAIKLRQGKPASAHKLATQAHERLGQSDHQLALRAVEIADEALEGPVVPGPHEPVVVVFETRLGPLRSSGPRTSCRSS